MRQKEWIWLSWCGKEAVKVGEVDAAGKVYLSDPVRFADAFNWLVYDGKQVIDPDELAQCDPNELVFAYGNDATEPVQRIRDVTRIWQAMDDGRAAYVVLGVEAQDAVHYAMSVRCALYDAANYAGQVGEAAKSYRRKRAGNGERDEGEFGGSEVNENDRGPMTQGSAEFLSGFRKDDRLMPVVTLVVHFGEGDWDGPTSLHEMLDTADAEILRLVPDYKMNLLSPSNMSDDDLDRFSSDLGLVMRYIKYAGNKSELERITQGPLGGQPLDVDAMRLLNAAVGTRLAVEEGGQQMEMAKGFKELIDEYTEKGVKKGRKEGVKKGRKEGVKKGVKKGRKEGRREVLAELVREGILSAEDAAAFADVNVAEFELANATTEG